MHKTFYSRVVNKRVTKVFTCSFEILYYHVSCQMMVDAVLEIMQKAVVPWSNVVEKLVQQYLEMNGPKYVNIFSLLKWLPWTNLRRIN